MVLQACIDDSQTDAEVLVLAGYVATAEEWATFSDEWKRQLAEPPIWHKFKMKKARRRMAISANDRRRVEAHYQIILDHVSLELCFALPLQPFYKIADEFKIPRLERNPYFLAWNAIISLYTGYAKKIGITEPVEFIFDEQSENTKTKLAWEYLYGLFPMRQRKYIQLMPRYESDTRWMPLQAADFIASCRREEFLETGTVLSKRPPVPGFTQDIRHGYMVGQLDEAGIRRIVKDTFGSERYEMRSTFLMKSVGSRPDEDEKSKA